MKEEIAIKSINSNVDHDKLLDFINFSNFVVLKLMYVILESYLVSIFLRVYYITSIYYIYI